MGDIEETLLFTQPMIHFRFDRWVLKKQTLRVLPRVTKRGQNYNLHLCEDN